MEHFSEAREDKLLSRVTADPAGMDWLEPEMTVCWMDKTLGEQGTGFSGF